MSKRWLVASLDYLWALVAVLTATVVNLAFQRWVTPTVNPLLLAAVMFAAWKGGIGPGMFAAGLASVSLIVFFPQTQVAVSTVGSPFNDVFRTVVFLSTAGFISSLVEARRRAERAEHQRRILFEGMLTSVGDGVIGTDARGRVAFLNPKAEELTGWAKDEAIGQALEQVLTIKYTKPRTSEPATVEKALIEGRTVTLGKSGAVIIDRKGSRKPIDGVATPIRGPISREAGVVFVFRDVTAQRRFEEAVVELAAIVASSQDAIIGRGTDDKITSWNPAAEQLFGYSAAETLGRPLAMLVPPDRTDEIPRMLTKIENGVAVSHFETQRVRKDGRRLDISMSVSSLKDSEGNTIGIATIARDITEQKQAERRLMVQYEVSRILAESTTLAAATPRLLEAIGNGLRASVGVSWVVDDSVQTLTCNGIWHRGVRSHERFAEFSATQTFEPGNGLPGLVWQTGKPAWLSDIMDNPTFARMITARTAGLRTGIGFPICAAETMLGVMEFFTVEIVGSDEAMTSTLRVVGNQIGQFVERKRAEAELRVAEARFRALADSGIIGIVIGEIDGYAILDANASFLAMIGATRDDLQEGKIDWRSLVAPDYRETDDQAWAQLRATGVCDPYIKEYIGLHGRRVSVLMGLARLDDSSSHCIGFLIDITERRRTQQALQEREEQLRLALDVAEMGTWDWRLVTNETRWSDNLEAIHGVSRGTFDGKMQTFMSLVHPDDVAKLDDTIRDAIADKPDFRVEFRVFAQDGTIRWIHSRGRIFRDGFGDAVRVIGVSLNITEPKRAQHALEKATEAAISANLAKNQFLAVLSHELRTPLTPVLAGVCEMLYDPTLSESHGATLRMVRRNVELEARLIDDLLDITRIVQGKLRLEAQTVDAHELLGQTLDICMNDIRTKEITFEMRLDATAYHVQADPARLQQVFWNLIKNAVKFTSNGGHLSIRTENLRDGRLRIDVVDTGLGIAPEALPKIFNAFEQGDASITRRFGGLGLGLAISRSVVEALGGTLAAQSEGQNKGSTFTVELATTAAPRPSGFPSNDIEPQDSAKHSGPLRILLVEDNEDSLKILTRLLRARGHSVTPATTVATVDDLARNQRFDLLVSDLGLPDGSGFDVIQILLHYGPIPAIALSGYGMEADIQRSHQAGFSAHLIKPIDIQQLESLIDSVMAKNVVNQE